MAYSFKNLSDSAIRIINEESFILPYELQAKLAINTPTKLVFFIQKEDECCGYLRIEEVKRASLQIRFAFKPRPVDFFDAGFRSSGYNDYFAVSWGSAELNRLLEASLLLHLPRHLKVVMRKLL